MLCGLKFMGEFRFTTQNRDILLTCGYIDRFNYIKDKFNYSVVGLNLKQNERLVGVKSNKH